MGSGGVESVKDCQEAVLLRCWGSTGSFNDRVRLKITLSKERYSGNSQPQILAVLREQWYG